MAYSDDAYTEYPKDKKEPNYKELIAKYDKISSDMGKQMEECKDAMLDMAKEIQELKRQVKLINSSLLSIDFFKETVKDEFDEIKGRLNLQARMIDEIKPNDNKHLEVISKEGEWPQVAKIVFTGVKDSLTSKTLVGNVGGLK